MQNKVFSPLVNGYSETLCCSIYFTYNSIIYSILSHTCCSALNAPEFSSVTRLLAAVTTACIGREAITKCDDFFPNN